MGSSGENSREFEVSLTLKLGNCGVEERRAKRDGRPENINVVDYWPRQNKAKNVVTLSVKPHVDVVGGDASSWTTLMGCPSKFCGVQGWWWGVVPRRNA